MTSLPLNSSAVSNDVEALLVRKLLLRLLPFLFLLYIVNYLDRINVGFAALQMRGQLGFSDDVFGTGFGIFFIGYFFLQVPSNLALSRVGARRWMAAIMVVWGLVSCCMIFVRTVHGFYAMRFVLGAAEAGFFPGIILYLKTWFPARGRARAVAWFMTANPLAGVVGGPISGALLNLHQFRLAGWQWMFIIEGVPAVLLSLVVLFTLKDQPNEAEWLLPQEKAWLVEILERERQQQAVMRRTDVAAAFLNWRVWLMTVVYFGLTASGYGLILWMPNYIKSLASSLGNFGIGVVSVIPYMATAAAMVVVGSRSDRTGKHRAFLAGSALSAAAFLFIAANMSSIVPGLAFVSLALMATFSMQGPFWATSTSLLGGTAAAAGIAVINSLGNLGGYFGPKIIGLSRTWGSGFRGGMLVISACLVLASLVALMVRAQDGSSSSQRHPLQ